MTVNWKKLGAVAVSASTDTDVYTCPSSTQAVGKMFCCNRGASSTNVRVAKRDAGAAIANQHYLAYDVAVPGNTTMVVDVVGLAATDVMTARDSTGTTTFRFEGQEIT